MEVVIPAQPEPIKLDINRTALIVVDMQNAFCKKGGTSCNSNSFPWVLKCITQAPLSTAWKVQIWRGASVEDVIL